MTDSGIGGLEAGLSSLSVRVRHDVCEIANLRYAPCTRRVLEPFSKEPHIPEYAGKSSAIEVDGTLRWNEFEGGFWSLELERAHADLGEHVVLSGFELPPDAGDGALVHMRVRARPDLIDFTMAGMRVDVLDARLRR